MPAHNTHACHLAANIVRDFCGDIVAVGHLIAGYLDLYRACARMKSNGY